MRYNDYLFIVIFNMCNLFKQIIFEYLYLYYLINILSIRINKTIMFTNFLNLKMH